MGPARMLEELISRAGEEFDIQRGAITLVGKGVINTEQSTERPYIGFLPGTDVKPGDKLRGITSHNEYQVSQVTRRIAEGRVGEIIAYVDKPEAHRGPHIHVGSMVNSAIQQSSPGATQAVQATQQNRESAAEIIAALVAVLDQLGLTKPQRQEMTAEIETVQAQLKSPNPKWIIINEGFKGLQSTLQRVMHETVIATAGVVCGDLLAKIAAFLTGQHH